MAYFPGEPSSQPDGTPGSNPQARMAKVKTPFRSKSATITETKMTDALIDCGATHNFFDEKPSFTKYKKINPDVMQAAHGETTLNGRGTVFIPIGGEITQEAYYAPGFSSHIFAAHVTTSRSYSHPTSEMRRAAFSFLWGQCDRRILSGGHHVVMTYSK